MRTIRELAVLYICLGLAPLGPALAVTYVGLAWQATVLAALWAAVWYLWLWVRTQQKEGT